MANLSTLMQATEPLLKSQSLADVPDKEAARASLGLAPLARIEPTDNTMTFRDVAWPAGLRGIRISGVSVSSSILMACSTDGATFDFNNNYANSAFYAVGSAITAEGFATTFRLFLGPGTEFPSSPAGFEARIVGGGPGRATRLFGIGGGQSAAAFNTVYQGVYLVQAAIKAVRIYPSSGNFGLGTSILVEADP